MKQINRDRNGRDVEKSLLKNFFDVVDEIGNGKTDLYDKDFEVPLLDDCGRFYACKAASWTKKERNQVEDVHPFYFSELNSENVLCNMEMKMFLQLSNSISKFYRCKKL